MDTRLLAVLVLALAPRVAAAQASAAEPVPALDLSKVPDEGPVVTLPHMLRQAEAQNYDLQVARTRIAQAEASLKRTWGTVGPNLSANLIGTHNSIQSEFTFQGRRVVIQPSEQLNGVLDVRQPLFVMPAFLAIKSARLGVEAASATVAGARDQTLLAVAQAYYAALSSKRVIALAQLQLQAAQEQEKVARARFEVGQTAKVDMLSAGVQRTQAEQNLVTARNQYDSAKAALEALTGIGLPFQVTPPPPLEIPEVTPAQAVDTALKSRPELRASELSAQSADRNLHSAIWEFAPTLAAEAQYRYQNAAGFTGTNHYGLVQLTLAWTLYDGGTYANLDNARALLRQAEAQVGSTRASVVREVRTAIDDLQSARANLVTAQEQVGLGTENARLIHDRYQAGVATYLDVIEADNALFSAGVSAVTSGSSVETSSLALRKAMGKLGLALPPGT